MQTSPSRKNVAEPAEVNFGSKAIYLFFLIQCFKKKIILGKVCITGLKMLSLLICARVFKFSERKNCD